MGLVHKPDVVDSFFNFADYLDYSHGSPAYFSGERRDRTETSVAESTCNSL